MNALLREMDRNSVEETTINGIVPGELARFLVFPLRRFRSEVLVQITHRSEVGLNGFGELFLRRGNDVEAIDFPQLITLLVKERGLVGESTPRERLTFLRRVLDSAAAIGEVLDAPAPPCPARQRDPFFIEAEQGLRFGHSVHPTPRSREGFSSAEARIYAPEHGGAFPLRWWAAAPAALVHDSVADRPVPDLIADLIASDPLLRSEIGGEARDGRIPIPMHPWQAAHLMRTPEVRRLFLSGLLEDLGEAGSPWLPTSSSRTLWAEHAPWMLKVSLNVRLTNSIRTLELHELERGKEVSRLLNGPVWRELRESYPNFRVLGEPAHLALAGPDGKALAASAIGFRENPFRGADQPHAAMLATLCEFDPDGTGSRLADLVRRISVRTGGSESDVAEEWFDRFLTTALEPLLVAACDYGLLFGAHQQNVVLGLSEGWPEILYYRDCQGASYVRGGGRRFALQTEIPTKDRLIFEPDVAWRLVGYYLMINGVFAAVAALSVAGLTTESRLLSILRRFLERLAADPEHDPSLVTYLLSSPTLSAKRNFLLTFRNVNENTEVRDPLAVYVEVPNPAAGAQ